MDGDGKLDIVGARATVPTSGGSPEGELMWLKQPANWKSVPWVETVAASGPDVDFIMEDLNGDHKYEVIAAQFFSAEILAVYSCSEATWSLCSPSHGVTRNTIDKEKGPFFNVKYVDLNNDGKKDLLVSNNQDDGTGSVFAYDRAATGIFTRHMLASGFKPTPTALPSPGAHSRGSPGAVLPFHINTAMEGKEKPQVLLSGDDGGFVALLRPTSEESLSWSYSVEYIVNSTGTMGQPSLSDIDSDGITEVFVPFYSEDKVEAFTFNAKAVVPVSSECVSCLLKKDIVNLSPAYSWCYLDQKCHLVGSALNPCNSEQCTSAASASICVCTSCNDHDCRA